MYNQDQDKTQTKTQNLENIKDIIASISVVLKFNTETQILNSQSNLVLFLDELGFKTIRNKEFNIMNFRNMFRKLTHKERNEVFKEFDVQRMYDLIDVMGGA